MAGLSPVLRLFPQLSVKVGAGVAGIRLLTPGIRELLTASGASPSWGSQPRQTIMTNERIEMSKKGIRILREQSFNQETLVISLTRV